MNGDKDIIDTGVEILEKNKKSIFFTVLSVSLIGLIIVSTLFFFGIKVNFFLKDELELDITPLQKSLNLTHNMQENVTFTISNNNFRSCNTRCVISLNDISDNKNIFFDNITLEPRSTAEKIFSFSGNYSGEGQKIFIFEATCNNIKSTLCRSEEEKRYASSLITLNYQLTEEEKILKLNLKQEIDVFLKNVSYIEAIASENLLLSKKLPRYEYDGVSLADVESTVEKIEELWGKEDYYGLEKYFSKDILDDVYEKALKNNEEIKGAIVQYNEDVASYEDMIYYISKLEEAYNFYNMSGSVPISIVDLYLKIYEFQKDIKRGNMGSYQEFHENVDKLKKRFDSIINVYAEEKKEFYLKDFLEIYKSDILVKELNRRINNASYDVLAVDEDYDIYENCLLLDEVDKRYNISNNNAIQKRNSLAFNETLVEGYKENLIGYTENLIIDLNNSMLYPYISDWKINDPILIGNSSYYQYILLEQNFTLSYCSKERSSISFTLDDTEIENISIGSSVVVENEALDENYPECCIFDRCSICNDVANTNYPIIFVHGHAFNEDTSPKTSLNTFSTLQRKLNENGIINAGEIDLSYSYEDIPYSDWGRINNSISVRASFYYIRYYEVGSYALSTQKSESIENYAIRLKEMIDVLKYRAGTDKVIIIAHSMGGLVAREYMALFGEDNVDKLIMIATPNKGITGDVSSYCTITGSKKECEDMKQDSVFLKRLNTVQNEPQETEVYNIIGMGCEMDEGLGDGIVLKENAELDYANNQYVEGECTGILGTDLHGDIINYDETFNMVYEILK